MGLREISPESPMFFSWENHDGKPGEDFPFKQSLVFLIASLVVDVDFEIKSS